MLRPVEKMFTNIIEQSKNFIETINRDFENMNNNIDSIVSSAMGNGNNILSSMRESFMIAPHETFTLEANNSKMLDK